MSASHDEHVPHEAAVDAAIDDQMARTSDHAAIADLTVIATADPTAPGVGYVQAEADSVRDAVVDLLAAEKATQGKLNEILDVLRDAGLIPAS